MAGRFVAEVESLRPGIDQGRTASRAVGYRQILDALDIGDDPDTAREPNDRGHETPCASAEILVPARPECSLGGIPSQISRSLAR